MPRSSRWSAGHEQNRCIEPHSCSQLARGLYISAIFYSVMKMTNVKDLLSPSLLDKPIEKPAKRWRNLWFATCACRMNCGVRWAPGFHWGLDEHPSKGVAEERARDSQKGDLASIGWTPVIYVGAHPIPEGE